MNDTRIWKIGGDELRSREGKDEDGDDCILFSLPGGKALMPVQQYELDSLILTFSEIISRLTDMEAEVNG